MRAAYRDLWIRIGGSVLASHFIDALGRPQNFFQQLTSPYYYTDLLFGATVAY